MKLVRPTARTQRVLAMMKLTSMFETFDDEAGAIASYGAAG
jgi:hypothetical protein